MLITQKTSFIQISVQCLISSGLIIYLKSIKKLAYWLSLNQHEYSLRTMLFDGIAFVNVLPLNELLQ